MYMFFIDEENEVFCFYWVFQWFFSYCCSLESNFCTSKD